MTGYASAQVIEVIIHIKTDNDGIMLPVWLLRELYPIKDDNDGIKIPLRLLK
jgi:hypothetical protein